jgi:aminoglycoside phosphotransferase (APT) family kinase protein
MLYQPLNQPKILSYFQQFYPDRMGLRLDEVRRSYPGMSRETWWITIAWDAGETRTEKFVLRMDPPGGALSMSDLAYESRIYQALYPTAVPVPRLVVHEDRPEWLLEGREFSLREWTEGEVEPAVLSDPDPAAQPVRDAIIREQMEKLAILHALDWQTLGLDDILVIPSNPENCAREQLERLIADQAKYGIEPMPLFREIGRWLLDNPPSPPARIVLRKENNGIGEEIWRDGKIVGMCDWESASLGDPALDVAVAMQTTAKYGSETAALAHYNASARDPIAQSSVDWYRMFWSFQAGMALQNGLANFRRGSDRRIQLLTLGVLYPSVIQSRLSAVAKF